MFFTCSATSHEHCDHGAFSFGLDAPDAFPQAGSTGEADGGARARKAPSARNAGAARKVAGAGKASAKSKAAVAGKTQTVGARDKQLRIDIHCHYQNNDVAAMAAPLKPFEREPSIVFANALSREVNQKQMRDRADKLTDIATRLRDMDRMGIDVQVVSPSPSQYYYYADADFGLQLSRTTNDRIAEIVAGNPDRFAGMCTVPLQDPKMAAKELDRCVRKLGMRGVEICTNVNGIDLADKRLGLDRFFAKAQELGVVVFMHPMGFTHADRLTDHYFNNIIGNPLESTLAVSHLIFGGVLDRFPGLKFIVAHGGGYLAHYRARMDHGWKARSDCHTVVKKKPSSYLRKFYYDTITFDPGMVESLVSLYGARQVMLGSDYPYDMADDNPVRTIESAKALGDGERNLILGGNAARLFGLQRRRAAR